jgi:hypothetical protein
MDKNKQPSEGGANELKDRELEGTEVKHNDIITFGQDVKDKEGNLEHRRVEMKVLFGSMAKSETADAIMQQTEDEMM